MRTSTPTGLTDNAWVRRIGELQQIVDDQYDPTTASPQEWVDWYIENDEGEIAPDEERVMLRKAEQIAAEYDDRS